MRRALALELSTLVVIAAGMLACTALGGWFVWVSPIGIGMAILAAALRERLPRLPWAPLTGVVALAGMAVPWSLGADVLGILASSLISLQLGRRFGRSSSSDDRASAILSLLMIVLAATADPTVVVGVSAGLWVVGVAPLGMLSHLVREGPDRRRSVSLHLIASAGLVAIVAFAAFLALPRLRAADLGPADAPSESARIGFRDEVQLGEVGTLLDDPTPVLRVTLPPGSRPLTYLRGIVLDRFDGRGWLATFPDDQATAAPPSGAIPIRIQAEPSAGVVAFAPGSIAHISDSTVSFLPDVAGNWRIQEAPRRLSYTAWVRPADAEDAASNRWKQLPDDLDPRIHALAMEVLPRDQPPLIAAETVATWLKSEATYTYAPRDTKKESPLSTFLFERKTGHCEYFATAAAVLLRARGFSTRVVNGYARPEYNAAGGYWLARRGHAHSWIEIQDRHGTWTRVDPTPGGSRPPEAPAWSILDAVRAGWNGRVLAYDGSTQVRVVRSAGWFVQSRITGTTPGDAMPWLGLLALTTVLAALTITAAWALQSLGRRLAGEASTRPAGPIDRVHRRARRWIARRGWQIPDHLPPVEAARWVANDSEEIGACLEQIAWMHYRVRFAGEDSGPLVKEARDRLSHLRTLLRQTPAPPTARR